MLEEWRSELWYPSPRLAMRASSSRGEYLAVLPEREKELEKLGEVVDFERDSWATWLGEEGLGDKRRVSSSWRGGKACREGLRLVLVIAQRKRSIFRGTFKMVGHCLYSHDQRQHRKSSLFFTTYNLLLQIRHLKRVDQENLQTKAALTADANAVVKKMFLGYFGKCIFKILLIASVLQFGLHNFFFRVW